MNNVQSDGSGFVSDAEVRLLRQISLLASMKLGAEGEQTGVAFKLSSAFDLLFACPEEGSQQRTGNTDQQQIQPDHKRVSLGSQYPAS